MRDLGTYPACGSCNYNATGINSAGQAVGNGPNAFIGSPLTQLNGLLSGVDIMSRADGINSAGQVVGAAFAGSGAWHAVLWPSGATNPLDLNTLAGSLVSYAKGINTDGEVVGQVLVWNPRVRDNEWHAFRWHDDNGNRQSDPGEMQDLMNVIPADSGWLLTEARGINDAG